MSKAVWRLKTSLWLTDFSTTKYKRPSTKPASACVFVVPC